MVKEVLGKCPVCGEDTKVTKIHCDNCNTSIDGSFSLCRFCKLTPEQKLFAEVFIKCRGNIKEVEKELGISYPTVKNKLEDTATALGYQSAPETQNSEDKSDILKKLNNGELSVEDAINLLKE